MKFGFFLACFFFLIVSLVVFLDQRHQGRINELKLMVDALHLQVQRADLSLAGRPERGAPQIDSPSQSDSVQSKAPEGSAEHDNRVSLSVVSERSEDHRVKFSDSHEPVESASIESPLESADDYYQRVYERMALDGLSPEQSELLDNALTVDHGASFDHGVTYSPPICSEYQCFVKSNLSEAQFSSDGYETNEFVATDSYTMFVGGLTRSLSRSMGRPVQVSITRFNDQAIIRVAPNISSHGRGEGK